MKQIFKFNQCKECECITWITGMSKTKIVLICSECGHTFESKIKDF